MEWAARIASVGSHHAVLSLLGARPKGVVLRTTRTSTPRASGLRIGAPMRTALQCGAPLVLVRLVVRVGGHVTVPLRRYRSDVPRPRSNDPSGNDPGDGEPDDDLPGDAGERRAPVIVAGAFTVGLPFLMPEFFRNDAGMALSAVQLVLLIAMFALDPGRIDRRSRNVHLVRLALVGSLALGAATSVARMVSLILQRHGGTGDAEHLLWAGALVWVHLVLAFAFLYWELDAGGPGERAHHPPGPGDLLFPQQSDPELSSGEWRPVFFDYLHMAAVGAISFSPGDVVVLSHRAKAATVIESGASLAILGLVVARAINILN